MLYFEKAKGRPSDSTTKRVMKPLYDRYRCVRRMVRLSSTSVVHLSRGPSTIPAPRASLDSGEVPISSLGTEGAQVGEIAMLPNSEPVAAPETTPIPEVLLVTSSTNFSNTDTDRTASLASNAPDPSISSTSSSFLNWELSLLEFAQSAKNLDSNELTRGRAEILSVKHKLQRLLHDYEKRIQEATSNIYIFFSQSSYLFLDHPPSKRDRDILRGEYNRYRDCKQRLYVIDQLLEKPQANPEGLIIDAQSVGRAHRRKRIVEKTSTQESDVLVKQKVASNRATPLLKSHDSASCT